MLPGGLPWLGHALALRRDPVALMLDGRRRVGDVFAIQLAGTRVTVFLGRVRRACSSSSPRAA